MTDAPIVKDIQEIQSILSRLENITREIAEYKEYCNKHLDSIKEECTTLITDAKAQLHQTILDAQKCGHKTAPEVPIEDTKLKNAYIALYWHYNGATADTVAKELNRHRSTVSTYLNFLVHMGYATKRREGHEIYYTVVPMKNEGTSE